MTEVLANIIPILVLISFGFLAQRKQWIKAEAVDEVKKAVINAALPAVLFQTFVRMELRKEYFIIMIMSFVLMVLLLTVGSLVNKIKCISHPLTPFMVSGFTFGLLGVPLYSTVFGVENLGNISVLGVGHEFFVWFIYYTLLEIKLSNKKLSIEMTKGFIKSPLIIAIVLGMLLNITNFSIILEENYILKGLNNTISYIGSLATPTILMIVGYGLKLEKRYMRLSVKFVLLRYAVILTIGYLFKGLIINPFLQMDKLFNYAYFTFLILPQPLSLSIFVSKYGSEEQQNITSNTIVLATIVSVTLFLLFVLII
jgi:malate permease and related proteins